MRPITGLLAGADATRIAARFEELDSADVDACANDVGPSRSGTPPRILRVLRRTVGHKMSAFRVISNADAATCSQSARREAPGVEPARSTNKDTLEHAEG